jgi:hypothetical protein
MQTKPKYEHLTQVQLKLSLHRLQLLQQKKKLSSTHIRTDVGGLLKLGKWESARIRIEHVIREDFLVEALELVELYVDTLLSRFGLVTTIQYHKVTKGNWILEFLNLCWCWSMQHHVCPFPN